MEKNEIRQRLAQRYRAMTVERHPANDWERGYVTALKETLPLFKGDKADRTAIDGSVWESRRWHAAVRMLPALLADASSPEGIEAACATAVYASHAFVAAYRADLPKTAEQCPQEPTPDE